MAAPSRWLTALHGGLLVDSISLIAAFAAGFVSFASPCVVPVIPGILTVITGTNITVERPDPGRTLRDSLLFVGGFSLVFVVPGASATTIGGVIYRNQALLARVTGVLMMAMGVYMLASLGNPPS